MSLLFNEITLGFCLIELMTFLSAALFFYRSQNLRLPLRRRVTVLALGVLLSAIYAGIRCYSPQYAQVFSFTAITLLFSLSVSQNRNRSLAIGFISCAFSHFPRFVSALLFSGLMTVFGAFSYNFFTLLLPSALLFLQTALFFRVRRFRNGIQFFDKTENLGFGLFLAATIFVLTSIDLRQGFVNDLILSLLLVGSAIAGIGMYFWVRINITRRYRTRMQNRDAERLHEELAARDREIEQLRRTNEYLAKVIHRDSHLLYSFIEGDEHTDYTETIAALRTIARERNEWVQSELREAALLPATGSEAIDRALRVLALKAAARGIDLSIDVRVPLTDASVNKVPQVVLQTLICDHVKDAILAITAESGGRILLRLARDGDAFTVTVFDNGEPFRADVLDRLGVERVTTRAGEDGTGIGFMQTFDILRQYRAALILTELEEGMGFTKSLCFRFDGSFRFVIRSPRADALRAALTRDDVEIV